jgi:hypothetical protein
MDYNWALALMLLGFVALEKRRPFGAAVLLGLAVGTRLSSFIFVITAYWTAWRNSKGSTSNLALSATISATIAIAFYVPSYAWAGYTFSFLSGHLGAPELWRPTMRLGRFVLRNVELVGLPFILTLGLVVTQSIWRRALPTAAVQSWIPIAALNIVGYELLYLKYPLDKAYLIPALPFAMLAVCHFIADRKVFRWALLGATILNGLVAVSFAKPDVKGAASQARFGIWLDAGELATDINLRWSTRHCATYGCVNAERNKAE